MIWNYEGLTTEDMASRITTFSEYTISSAVSDVRSIESHTYPGVGGGEQLVVSPPDGLKEGARVTVSKLDAADGGKT